MRRTAENRSVAVWRTVCRVVLVAGLSTVWLEALSAVSRGEGWRAGVGVQDITPKSLMWMAGYGHRDHPAEGKLLDLSAKALCLEDERGTRALLVTLDLVGVDRQLSQEIRDELARTLPIDRMHVVLSVSHTHTGPVVQGNLSAMNEALLDDAQRQLVIEYAGELKRAVVSAGQTAVSRLEPCRLSWGSGAAAFAVNRRNNPEADVPARRTAGTLAGPSDHTVPVLAIRATTGAYRVIVFGYACHATVLSSYQWSGDYPGYAQRALEQDFPDCVAMFWAGCGGDQNPLPRRDVELARRYGDELAGAVKQVLDQPLPEVAPRLGVQYDEIDLALGTLPSRDQLQAEVQSKDKFVAARARQLLNQIDRGTPLSATYPYPIARWELGEQIDWVFLGGEVVVDYALRLKASRRGEATWVAGYTNDVMAYIPSRRVLNEGGYEGGGAMVYYGLPTTWSPDVEAQIVDAVMKP